MTNWYTADTHFGHENVIALCGRPFRNVGHMDMVLIENLWSKVRPEDDLWIIGDFAFGPKAKEASYLETLFGQLPGTRKHLVIGNHDLEPTLALPWDSISHLAEVKDGPGNLAHTLCHYPMITWNRARRGALQIFGHVHGQWKGSRNSINVGVDVWDFMPVRFEDIARRAKTLPVNRHCPVVVIWGNHEPYGSIWSELLADEERQLAELRAEGLDIRVLHGAATEVAGVRIIGAPLWTDLKLFPELEGLAWGMVGDCLMDYQRIGVTPSRMFCVRTMLDQHAMDKAAIWDALRQPHDGPTIVMTHHIPVHQLVHPAREVGNDNKRALCAGFASDLWSEIKGYDIQTWICGHSHDNEAWVGKGKHGLIRFVMNGRGYPGEEVEFDPAFVLEV